MDYNNLLDLATEIGYRLAMAGAETYRVEESIIRILNAYGIQAEVFAIPNCLTVSMYTKDGENVTKMRRIGQHGNDLDSVEKFSNLSRKICAEAPQPQIAVQWLKETEKSCINFSLLGHLIGNFLGAAGFALFFGGGLLDSVCAGICGLFIGIICYFLDKQKVNAFFRIIVAAFFMAVLAYGFGAMGIANNTDAVVIGSLMILVPGLLFTNAMRDIIYGDTNSGINRITQVLLCAVAIALGTGVAWSLCKSLWSEPLPPLVISHNYVVQAVACLVGCLGFAILFNVHGPGGLLCTLGGLIAWSACWIAQQLGCNLILCNFIAAVVAAVYSEIMARVRKYPAISYLVVSIFPLLPGAGIYYTTNHFVQGNMDKFTSMGSQTIAVAGTIAIGILFVSTTVRFCNVISMQKKTAN